MVVVVAKDVGWLNCQFFAFKAGFESQGRPGTCFARRFEPFHWFLYGFGPVELVEQFGMEFFGEDLPCLFGRLKPLAQFQERHERERERDVVKLAGLNTGETAKGYPL